MTSAPFHPDLRSVARWLPRGVGRPWWVALLRRLPVPAGPARPGVTVRDQPVEPGHPVTVRVYRPAGEQRRPVVSWIHGGGYVMGAARWDDALCVRLAERLDAVVVSVDYRLAPEFPFPTPLEDCLAAWTFVLREATALGVDPSRSVVAGRSAGGGLAAALVSLLKDRGLPGPALQVLVYPMLDDRTVLREVDGRHHRVWDQASNRYGWTSYLANTPGAPEVPEHAAPARRADLSGLPPTWIGVGTLDLFHDEDASYAARLRAAGVDTTFDVVEGAFHGFDVVLPGAEVSRRFVDSFTSAMEAALRRP